jgi:23S rRNA (pseudouridine1915-N3)-methyltransferase
MKIHLVWIGKTKDAHCAALVNEFLKRLSRYVSIELSELKEASGSADEAKVKQAESLKILAAVERDDLVILLDEKGSSLSSIEFSELINAQRNSSIKRVAFIIGGFAGVSDEVKKRAQLTLALSKMTLTHEFARVLLTEQIYRAYTLLAGVPYHKF